MWKNAAESNVGAAYVFTESGENWQLETLLVAPDAQASDAFGTAVAIVGNRILVSAPYADTPQGFDSGAVYVFVHNGVSWSLEEKLLRASGSSGDHFGSRIAVSGQWVFVTATYATSPSAISAGVVRVYRATPSGLEQSQDLFAPDALTFDFLGSAVVLASNVLYVGAAGVDLPGQFNAGAVYRFELSAGSWTPIDRFTATSPTEGSLFGSRLAIDGTRLAVASPTSDEFESAHSGQVHVFDVSGSTPTLMASLTRSGAGLPSWFGLAIAMSGDDLFVSNTSLGSYAGRVIRYRYSNGTWTQAEVMADFAEQSGVAADWFGYSLASEADRVLIGAPLSVVGDRHPGAAFEYRRDAALGWQRTKFIRTQDVPLTDQFGHAVSMQGDTMLIASVKDDTPTAREAGSVSVFRRLGESWVFDRQLFCPEASRSDRCGSNVILTNNFAFIAVSGDDYDGKTDAGSVFAYKRMPDGSFGVPITIRPANVHSGSYFGTGLAADSERLLIGASGQQVGGASIAGSVFAYHLVDGNWQLQSQLTPLIPESNLYFGISLSLQNDRLAVSRGGTVSSPTVAQVYQWTSGQWQNTQQVPLPLGIAFNPETVLLSGAELIMARESFVAHYRETADQWQFESFFQGASEDPTFGKSAALLERHLAIAGSQSLESFHLTSAGWLPVTATVLTYSPERNGLALGPGTIAIGRPQATGAITGMSDSGDVLVYDVMSFDGGFE